MLRALLGQPQTRIAGSVVDQGNLASGLLVEVPDSFGNRLRFCERPG